MRKRMFFVLGYRRFVERGSVHRSGTAIPASLRWRRIQCPLLDEAGMAVDWGLEPSILQASPVLPRILRKALTREVLGTSLWTANSARGKVRKLQGAHHAQSFRSVAKPSRHSPFVARRAPKRIGGHPGGRANSEPSRRGARHP